MNSLAAASLAAALCLALAGSVPAHADTVTTTTIPGATAVDITPANAWDGRFSYVPIVPAGPIAFPREVDSLAYWPSEIRDGSYFVAAAPEPGCTRLVNSISVSLTLHPVQVGLEDVAESIAFTLAPVIDGQYNRDASFSWEGPGGTYGYTWGVATDQDSDEVYRSGTATLALATPVDYATLHTFVGMNGTVPSTWTLHGASFNVTDTCPGAGTAPAITSANPPAGQVSSAYSATVTATGTEPITFSVSSGALPAGIILNETTGVLSGMPTAAGSSTFTIKATNPYGAASQTTTVLIASASVAGSAPTITSANPPAGTVGLPYSATVTADGSQPITFSVSAGTLPPGLSLDPATGVISGTPTTAADYTSTITATNSTGTDTQTTAITVAAAAAPTPPAITPVPPSTQVPALASTGADVTAELWLLSGALFVALTLLTMSLARRRKPARE